MSTGNAKLRIGYIPLVDAAALLVAVDKGFATAEGLDIELVREVSWSNVRDKLNIGLFDAAHLLAPVAVASTLGIGHVRVPLVVPFNLNLNGNAITVTPALFRALAEHAQGDIAEPIVSARALARLVAERRQSGAEPLAFGMTFPFSNHNYQLRFWMAAGGVDPDEDVRLVVLPPPYMVESLASGHVDAFCVGAPWNSVAVDLGIGRILHFGSAINARASEKVLAMRRSWLDRSPGMMERLVRALAHAAAYVGEPANREEVAGMLSAPERIGVSQRIIRGALDGALRVSPDGATHTDRRYILINAGDAARPDPQQAAWIYAQMVRWGQAPLSPDLLAAAKAVYRPDLFDATLGANAETIGADDAEKGVSAFTGPVFNGRGIESYLSTWDIRQRALSIVPE